MDINQANKKLSRVKLREKRNRYFLRATLPSKDGVGNKRYELPTGFPQTDTGLKLALAQAQRLESELMLQQFSWERWGNGDNSENGEESHEVKTIGQWCEEFEALHWQTKQKTPGRQESFKNDYGIALRQLPPDEPLTAEVLKRVLLRSEPDTRARQRNHLAYTRLAKFAGVSLPPEWGVLKGHYQPGTRTIPTDDQIIEIWERLTGRWKWAFGVMAAYGLRNHEIVRLSLEKFPVIQIWKNTKTKDRLVYPLHPEWAEKFNLLDADPPRLTSEVNADNGSVVCRAFKRHGIEFSPYSLRHSYAIRAAKLGLSPAIAAKWMGHSLGVHYKTYLSYIEQSDFDEAWQSLSGEQLGNAKPENSET